MRLPRIVDHLTTRARASLASRFPRSGTAYNASWLFAGQVVGLLATFIATPIQLDRMGSERYGVVVLTSAAIGSLALLDLGVGWAVMRSVPWHRERGGEAQARRLVGSALLIALAAGVIGGLILVLASGRLVDLFDLSPDVREPARNALRVAGVALPFVLLNSVFSGVARVAGMFRATAALNALLVVGLNIFWAAVAGRENDVVLVAAAQLVLAAGISCVWVWLLHRRAHAHLFPFSTGMGATRELLSFGGKLAAGAAGMAAATQADKLVLGTLLPVSELATYSIPAALAMRIALVSSSLASALLPRMSAIASRGDLAETRRIGFEALRTTALAGGLLAALCIFGGRAFLQLWVDASFARDAWGPLIALALAYAVVAVGMMASIMLDAAGRVGISSACAGFGGAVALGLATVGAAVYDTTLGAAVGMAIGLSLSGGLPIEISRRIVLRWRLDPVLRAIGVPWAALALAGGLSLAVLSALSAPALVVLAGVATACGLVAARLFFRPGASVPNQQEIGNPVVATEPPQAEHG